MLRHIPLLNAVGLVSVWFWERWGVVTAIGLGVATIGFDVAFGIWYHMFVAVPALLILRLGVAWYRDKFQKGSIDITRGN